MSAFNCLRRTDTCCPEAACITRLFRTTQGAPAMLKEASSKWKLHKDKPEAIPPKRSRQPVSQQDGTPWLLEDAAGNVTHKGHLEGGIDTSNYFLLVKEHGAFTALPLAAWYNFRPPPRRVAMSLEEAEAEMEKKHNSRFSGTSRLSKAIAANEGARNQYNHISYQCILVCKQGL